MEYINIINENIIKMTKENEELIINALRYSILKDKMIDMIIYLCNKYNDKQIILNKILFSLSNHEIYDNTYYGDDLMLKILYNDDINNIERLIKPIINYYNIKKIIKKTYIRYIPLQEKYNKFEKIPKNIFKLFESIYNTNYDLLNDENICYIILALIESQNKNNMKLAIIRLLNECPTNELLNICLMSLIIYKPNIEYTCDKGVNFYLRCKKIDYNTVFPAIEYVLEYFDVQDKNIENKKNNNIDNKNDIEFEIEY
jgi:hypothetical protein